jgi:hypothetical protein
MATDISVSALAERIGAHILGDREYPELRDQVLRPLRHWSALGVLRPTGGAMTGTGTHRRYGEEFHPTRLSRRLAELHFSHLSTTHASLPSAAAVASA